MEFEIGRRLGKGSYGRVHECKTGGGETLAIKIVKRTDEGIASPLELSIMMSYKHPNLNYSENIAYDKNYIYIVQEVAECDLDAYLRTNEPENREEFYSQLLKGLHVLHSEGIIHCDLKPQNVLVTKAGTLKITDYSHSVLYSREYDSFQHKVGSPCYSAPEILLGNIWGVEIDMWSLGCVFYEISTKTKFLSDVTRKTSDREIVKKIRSRQFAKSKFHTKEEENLILNYMLQESPRERYSCSEILTLYFDEQVVSPRRKKYVPKRDPTLASFLEKRTKDKRIVDLAMKINERSSQIKTSFVKTEACFFLASKIIEGYCPVAETISPLTELLAKELEICEKTGFLIH